MAAGLWAGSTGFFSLMKSVKNEPKRVLALFMKKEWPLGFLKNFLIHLLSSYSLYTYCVPVAVWRCG